MRKQDRKERGEPHSKRQRTEAAVKNYAIQLIKYGPNHFSVLQQSRSLSKQEVGSRAGLTDITRNCVEKSSPVEARSYGLSEQSARQSAGKPAGVTPETKSTKAQIAASGPIGNPPEEPSLQKQQVREKTQTVGEELHAPKAAQQSAKSRASQEANPQEFQSVASQKVDAPEHQVLHLASIPSGPPAPSTAVPVETEPNPAKEPIKPAAGKEPRESERAKEPQTATGGSSPSTPSDFRKRAIGRQFFTHTYNTLRGGPPPSAQVQSTKQSAPALNRHQAGKPPTPAMAQHPQPSIPLGPLRAPPRNVTHEASKGIKQAPSASQGHLVLPGCLVTGVAHMSQPPVSPPVNWHTVSSGAAVPRPIAAQQVPVPRVSGGGAPLPNAGRQPSPPSLIGGRMGLVTTTQTLAKPAESTARGQLRPPTVKVGQHSGALGNLLPKQISLSPGGHQQAVQVGAVNSLLQQTPGQQKSQVGTQQGRNEWQPPQRLSPAQRPQVQTRDFDSHQRATQVGSNFSQAQMQGGHSLSEQPVFPAPNSGRSIPQQRQDNEVRLPQVGMQGEGAFPSQAPLNSASKALVRDASPEVVDLTKCRTGQSGGHRLATPLRVTATSSPPSGSHSPGHTRGAGYAVPGDSRPQSPGSLRNSGVGVPAHSRLPLPATEYPRVSQPEQQSQQQFDIVLQSRSARDATGQVGSSSWVLQTLASGDPSYHEHLRAFSMQWYHVLCQHPRLNGQEQVKRVAVCLGSQCSPDMLKDFGDPIAYMAQILQPMVGAGAMWQFYLKCFMNLLAPAPGGQGQLSTSTPSTSADPQPGSQDLRVSPIINQRQTSFPPPQPHHRSPNPQAATLAGPTSTNPTSNGQPLQQGVNTATPDASPRSSTVAVGGPPFLQPVVATEQLAGRKASEPTALGETMQQGCREASEPCSPPPRISEPLSNQKSAAAAATDLPRTESVLTNSEASHGDPPQVSDAPSSSATASGKRAIKSEAPAAHTATGRALPEGVSEHKGPSDPRDPVALRVKECIRQSMVKLIPPPTTSPDSYDSLNAHFQKRVGQIVMEIYASIPEAKTHSKYSNFSFLCNEIGSTFRVYLQRARRAQMSRQGEKGYRETRNPAMMPSDASLPQGDQDTNSSQRLRSDESAGQAPSASISQAKDASVAITHPGAPPKPPACSLSGPPQPADVPLQVAAENPVASIMLGQPSDVAGGLNGGEQIAIKQEPI